MAAAGGICFDCSGQDLIGGVDKINAAIWPISLL